MLKSFIRRTSPVADPTSKPAAAGGSATGQIVESHSNQLAGVSTATTGSATAAGGWLARIQQAFGRWTESHAHSRADAHLWDVARSDPRIMGELMHARMRDDNETLVEPAAVLAMPAAPVLEAMPAERPPHQRTAGQGWGRIIEDAYQNRFHQRRQQHA
jgi:hypothetical protein